MTNQAPMTNDQKEAVSVGHGPLVILAALAGVFLLMAGWTWFGWNDPVVDFGRELYVPWQIVKGKLLYRDIAYFNGPLSPYFNAVLFTIFGASLRTVALANLLLLAGMTFVIWKLWVQISDRFAAMASCLTLLGVFAFLQLVATGNYNFITPYSHEVTHGITLSFLSILFLSRFLNQNKPWQLWMSGLLLGLIFLTKPEIFAAAGSAVGLGVALIGISRSQTSRQKLNAIGGFVVSAFLPPFVTLILFALKLPLRDAFHAVIGAWAYLGDRRLWEIPLYQRTLGTFDLSNSITTIILATVLYGVLIAVAVVTGKWLSRKRFGSFRSVTIIFLATLVVGGILFSMLDLGVWQQAIRGWTIVLPLLAIGAIIGARKGDPRSILQAVLAVFATVLLARIFLNVRTYHYGFALAMPATLLVVAWVLHGLPELVDRHGGNGLATRGVMAGVLAIFIFAHLYVFDHFYARKSVRVTGDFGYFFADPIPRVGNASDHRGQTEMALLAVLRTLPPKATLACIPEGAMLNCQAGRDNSTAYVSLVPPELLMFGADRVLADFKAHPPDYILLTETQSEDYGPDMLKRYGGGMMPWIEQNYEPLRPPAVPEGMPPVLLRHISPQP